MKAIIETNALIEVDEQMCIFRIGARMVKIQRGANKKKTLTSNLARS
jgi:hypothetical protein